MKLIGFLTLVFCLNLIADEGVEKEKKSQGYVILKTFADKIQQKFKSKLEGCKVVYSKNEVEITLNMRTYFIHRKKMMGMYSKKTYPERAPAYNGIVIFLVIGNGPYMGKYLLPVTLNHPYWKQYVNSSNSNDGKSYCLLSVKYGHAMATMPEQVDAIFKETLKEAKY